MGNLGVVLNLGRANIAGELPNSRVNRQPWEPISALIYGFLDILTDKFFNEQVRRKSREKLEALRQLWGQLREDILEEAKKHGHKPWGRRFDRRGKF